MLGPFEVVLDGRPVTPQLGQKPRALLAYLAVEANRAHARETLAELLWPDVLAASARASLSQALTSLRDALPDADGQPPLMLTTRNTVQFNPASDYALDLWAFEGALEAPERADHTAPATLTALDAAVATYRGAFLEGLNPSGSEAFETWLLLQRERAQRLVLEALHALAAAHLARGNPEAAIGAAQRQLELDLWREEAHQQLMQAYAQAGRRSDALAQYEKCQRVLQEALHVAPSPQTRLLAEQIRQGQGLVERPPTQSALGTSTASEPVPERRPALPVALTPFIGRERELAQLVPLLLDPQVRLVTLVGVGGIGKTRLALEAVTTASPQLPPTHGIVFVPLAGVAAPELLAPALASALGMTLAADDGAQTPFAQLTQALRDRHLLLVLDNFEQLLPEGSALALQMLQQAPGVKLLVTSREALQVMGEWVFEVNGLGHDAVALFLQAARRAQTSLQLSLDELAVVEHICRRVGEMPLAVELAGSWMRALSVPEIADEIERDIGFLESNLRDIPARHRSILAVCDSTWKMLSADERRVMQALSSFAGGFTYEAAKGVAGASIHMLSSLVAKSLVQRAQHSRYSLHPVIQRYSAAQLEVDPDLQRRVKHTHLAFYSQLAGRFAAEALGARMPAWMAAMAREQDNLQAALNWAAQTEPVMFVQLLLDALEFLYHRDPYSGYQWMQRALQMLRLPETPLPERLRVRVLLRATHLITDRPRNETLAREALALARYSEDEAGIAEALRSIAANVDAPERMAEVLPLFEESARRFTALGDRAELYDTLSLYARTLEQQGHIDAADEIATRALAVARELNSPIMIAHGLSTLSGIAQLRGDLDQALALGHEASHIFEHTGSKRGAIAMLSVQASMALWQQDHALARQRLEQAKALADELGMVAEKRHLLNQLERLRG